MRDSTMTVGIAILTSILAGFTGCASVRATEPSASAAVRESSGEAASWLVGDWRGVITGTELETAEGQKAASATVHVNADHTWTATTKFGTSSATSAGTVRRVGDHVLLDGAFVGGDAKLVGESVAYDLIPRPSGLFGLADTYFFGEPMRVPMMLQKVG